MVKDIFPGLQSSNITQLSLADGEVYFSASDGVGGTQLWRSDGTAAGTALALDITRDGTDSNPTLITNVGPWVALLADDGAHGRELYAYAKGAAGAKARVYLPLVQRR
jgi:ELWxxDGT repeat protein